METLISTPLRQGLLQKEAAQHLGVSERTQRRWYLDGYGPQPYRDGSRLLYNAADLAAFAAGGR